MVAGAPRCRLIDLLAAVTHESPGLDPAGSLFRIEWVRVVWARAGGGPARSAALWSWSLGGFQTLPGVYGDERGSPSVLGREWRKESCSQTDYISLFKKEGRQCNNVKHPPILFPETVLAGRISVKHFPASCCCVIDSIFSFMTLFHHLLYLVSRNLHYQTLLCILLWLFFKVFSPPVQKPGAVFKRVDG